MKREKETNTSQTGYRQTFSNSHIQLIALGGTIGTGLSLGVGDSIHRADPSVILVFIIIGLFLFLLMCALGELILSNLKKRTCIEFIEKYLGRDIGLIGSYLYWISWLILAMAELTALGIYFEYWSPHLLTWLPGLITMVVLLIINLISAKVFGNLEFSFAIIKILTILAFVAMIGYFLIVDESAKYSDISLADLSTGGGLFAKGSHEFLLGLRMVIFSFIGVELIGLTATEAQGPENTVSQAIDQLPVGIILFYVVAIITVLVAVPWPKISTANSLFIQALNTTGIKNAGSIINSVVANAAISSINSFLYSAGWLLFSVNFDGKSKWSKTFNKLSKTQVPRNALIFSSLVVAYAPLIILIIGGSAFTFVSATSTSMFLITWATMILTHIRHRKEAPREDLKSFRMPLFPYLDYLVLAFLIAMIGLLLYLEKFRTPVIAALIALVILYLITKFFREKESN